MYSDRETRLGQHELFTPNAPNACLHPAYITAGKRVASAHVLGPGPSQGEAEQAAPPPAGLAPPLRARRVLRGVRLRQPEPTDGAVRVASSVALKVFLTALESCILRHIEWYLSDSGTSR